MWGKIFLKDHAYTLVFDHSGITITTNTFNGLSCGVQPLR